MKRKTIIYLSLYCTLCIIGIVSFAYLLGAGWEGKKVQKFLGILASGVIMIFAKEKAHQHYRVLKEL